MGKQPTTGQKKSKDSIMKAASQKKGGAKKWTKGKAKEKVDHAVFLDNATYERLMTGIPKIGKHISVSQVIEKYKVVGSVARQLIRRLVQSGALKVAESHSRQGLFTPVVTAATVAATNAPAEGKGAQKGAAKKPAKQAKQAKEQPAK